MEQQYKVWAGLSDDDKTGLMDYYKLVLVTGVCKQRTPDLLKLHKEALKWCVKKKLTIWDIPKHNFQTMQLLVVNEKMETPI